MKTVDATVTLTPLNCGGCGVAFAMPESLYRECLRNGRSFYCPNGHERQFTETVEQQLKEAQRELAKTARRLELKETTIREIQEEREAVGRRLSATRGVVTKLKNRAKAGLCPCCRRHFGELQRHMETQHPSWDPEGDGAS
jgi:hypothetical protein